MPRLRNDQIADGQIDSGSITDGSIVNVDISASAAIDPTKINTRYKEPVTAFVDLPVLNNVVGDIRLVKDLNTLWSWDGTEWKQVTLSGAAISGWYSYTPSLTGAAGTNPTKGTATTDRMIWRRVGTSAEFYYKYRQTSAGTAGSGTYILGMPSGMSPDVSLMLPTDAYQQIGTAKLSVNSDDFSVETDQGNVYLDNNGRIFINYVTNTSTTTTTYSWGSTAFSLSNPLISIEAHFTVPISGWGSNINLVSDFQEFSFNAQASINTNDTSSFGYGPQGTAILANTAETYYDITFANNILPTDSFHAEIRSKVDGSWINADDACIPSLFIGCINAYYHYGGNTFTKGIRIAKIAANKIRVIFSNDLLGGTSALSGTAGLSRAWSALLSAADGFDRWRIHKTSNNNQAESATYGIFESGPGYIKLVDGTLMQWVTNLAASSGLTRTFTITWPVPFADTNYTMTHSFYENSSGTGSYNTATGLKTLTGMTYAMYVNADNGISYGDFFAIGRWNTSRQIYSPGTLVGDDIVTISGQMGTAMTNPTGPIVLKFDDFWTSSGITYESSTGKFIVQTTGDYRITLNPFWNTGVSGGRLLVGKNTLTPTTSNHLGHAYHGGTTYETGSINSVVHLVAGDYIVFYLVAGQLYNQSSDRFNQFSIVRL